MKRITNIFIALLLTTNVFSASYQKMTDSSKVWNYRFDVPMVMSLGGTDIRTYSLFFSNDTIINSIKYKKVMCEMKSYHSTDTAYAGALREDTIQQKVFVKTVHQNEKLAYSFKQQVGDTVSIDTLDNDNGLIIRSIKSVENFNLNGIMLKKIEICDTTYKTKPLPNTSESFTDTWYEGIGSLTGLFDITHLDQSPDQYTLDLLCVWNNGELLYDNPNWDKCEYIEFVTSLNNSNKDGDFIIYPNPTSDQITIETSQSINEVNILDINGRLLINTNAKTIDFSNLCKGIYFIKVKTGNNTCFTRRVIKR